MNNPSGFETPANNDPEKAARRLREAAEDELLLQRANKIKLDKSLPGTLEELEKWPADAPYYHLLPPLFVFQLGNLPCYAAIGPASDPAKPDTLEIYMMWTAPEHQQKGLARQMVKLLTTEFPRLTAIPGGEAGKSLLEILDNNG